MQAEFDKGVSIGTFEQVDKLADITLLLLTWVFRYKINSELQIERFKAKLCAQGDLQAIEYNTYAATLALQVFRFLIAFIVYFDLECKQFDFVNAYLNACFPTPIYLQAPDGIRNGNKVLLLKQALYGLKQARNLQQGKLTATLQDLGLLPILELEYVFTDSKIFIFFFVDDLLAAYHKDNFVRYDSIISSLLSTFEMH